MDRPAWGHATGGAIGQLPGFIGATHQPCHYFGSKTIHNSLEKVGKRG